MQYYWGTITKHIMELQGICDNDKRRVGKYSRIEIGECEQKSWWRLPM